MREFNYELAPLKPGQEDNNQTRLTRWEEKQGILLKKLTREEWIEVVSHILPMTRKETEEYLDYLIYLNNMANL